MERRKDSPDPTADDAEGSTLPPASIVDDDAAEAAAAASDEDCLVS